MQPHFSVFFFFYFLSHWHQRGTTKTGSEGQFFQQEHWKNSQRPLQLKAFSLLQSLRPMAEIFFPVAASVQLISKDFYEADSSRGDGWGAGSIEVREP